MENLDNLTEEEILAFEQKFKNQYLPNYRLFALVGYNIVVCGLSMYYTINFKKISKKIFKPRSYGFWDLCKFGTAQAIIFVSTYMVGTCAVTGLWNPVQYLRDLAKIKGKIIDNTLRHDD